MAPASMAMFAARVEESSCRTVQDLYAICSNDLEADVQVGTPHYPNNKIPGCTGVRFSGSWCYATSFR